MDISSPVTSATPIPVRATAGAAIRMIRAEYKNIFQIIAVPCLILALISGFLALQGSNNGDMPTAGKTIGDVIYAIVNLLVSSWLGVCVLRYLILAEKQDGWIPLYQRKMWPYLGYCLLLGLMAVIPAGILITGAFFALPPVIAAISALLLILAIFVVITRFSLVLPATAVNGNNRFKASWRATNGQVLRIMGIRFLTGLLILIPAIVVVIAGGLLGMAIPALGTVLIVWLLGIMQVTIMQVTDALLYAHFMPALSSEEAVIHVA